MVDGLLELIAAILGFYLKGFSIVLCQTCLILWLLKVIP